MFRNSERTIQVVEMSINIAPYGSKCEIAINKIFFNTLSEEQQDAVTEILQNTFQKVNKIIENKSEECCKGAK